MESQRLPPTVGPYSYGKIVKGMAFTSGQLGLDPNTGNLVSDSVEAQAEQAFVNLKNLAEDSGYDISLHTVKNTLYLVDMNDFAKVNDIYKRFYTEGKFPARTCIAVKDLPKGAKVEIESVLFKD
jgi:2-iminobutanoate/2-iminopropanoate deaminase